MISRECISIMAELLDKRSRTGAQYTGDTVRFPGKLPAVKTAVKVQDREYPPLSGT